MLVTFVRVLALIIPYSPRSEMRGCRLFDSISLKPASEVPVQLFGEFGGVYHLTTSNESCDLLIAFTREQFESAISDCRHLLAK
jgi:hypothetical protein